MVTLMITGSLVVQNKSFYNLFLLGMFLSLQGCWNTSGAYMGLTTATCPVLAVMADDFFTGEAIGYMDQSGVFTLKSGINDNTCQGSFHYTGYSGGIGKVLCMDGAEASFDFTSLSMLSGFGLGKSSRGMFSFTYGLTPEQASQYLKIPKGKKLKQASSVVDTTMIDM